MHIYYDAKEMLHKELEEIVKKGELSAGSLETIDKILNSIKNACKIIMYEEYSDEGEYSQEGGYSMARGGRGGNRGGRGRYSNEGEYSNEGGYANARGGRGGNRGGGRYAYARRGGYSYADENEEKVEMLREMMQEVNSDEERRALQKIIRKMEQE